MGKSLVWLIVAVVALVLVGMIVMSLLGALLKLALYLALGALVVGGLFYLWGRLKSAVRREDSHRSR